LTAGFWRTSTSRARRIITIVAFLLFSIFVTSIGTLTPLSREDANSLYNELEQVRQNVSVQYIFGNNLIICLVMFVPVVGPIFGLWALYNTGVVIAAESIVQGVPSLLIFYSLLIFPFAWLEFLSYSTALAESVWLIKRARRGMIRREVKNAAVLVAIVAVMLLVAAAIETALILRLGG
jgi:uncharacterized membrane protein SpoIIM required for sporulation